LRWPFELDESEGFWFLNADAAWLAQPARQIACPLGDLLIFLRGERPTRVVDDASLRLTWAELGERIARWDRFARAHADLPETKAEVAPAVKGYLFCYLCGMSNSLAYAGDTHALDPALRASYQRFVIESRDSSPWAYVDGLVKLLAQQGFRRTEAVEQYLNRADSPAPCGRFHIPGPH
jgi:hypothetical protein